MLFRKCLTCWHFFQARRWARTWTKIYIPSHRTWSRLHCGTQGCLCIQKWQPCLLKIRSLTRIKLGKFTSLQCGRALLLDEVTRNPCHRRALHSPLSCNVRHSKMYPHLIVNWGPDSESIILSQSPCPHLENEPVWTNCGGIDTQIRLDSGILKYGDWVSEGVNRNFYYLEPKLDCEGVKRLRVCRYRE